MEMGHTFRRTTRALTTKRLILLLGALLLLGATPVINLKLLGSLPESEQMSDPAQIDLQHWFRELRDIYMSKVRVTQIGRSSLVKVGDLARMNGVLRKSGDFYIVLRGGLSQPTTHSGPFESSIIAFPSDNPEAGSVGTWWHENVHAVLEGSSITFDPTPWFPAMMQNNPERFPRESTSDRRQHVLIEHAAELTFSWLMYLEGFEKASARAASRMEELKASGVPQPFSYELERGMWSDARARWKNVWPMTNAITGKGRSPQVPSNLRDEFEKATGVRAPMIEEVVSYYMTTGIEFAPARFSPVPEWVMSPLDKAMPVVFREDEGPVSDGFGFGLREARRGSPAVESGRLVFSADLAGQKSLKLTLRVGARTLPFATLPDGRYGVEVDLAALTPEIAKSFYSYSVHLAGQSPVQDVTVRVRAQFFPSPTRAYEPAEIITLLEVKAGGATPRVKTSALPLPPDWKATPAAGSDTWDLRRYRDGQVVLSSNVSIARLSSRDADGLWATLKSNAAPAPRNLGDATLAVDTPYTVLVHVRKGDAILTVASGLYTGEGVDHGQVVAAGWQLAEVYASSLAPAPPSNGAPVVTALIQSSPVPPLPEELDEVPPPLGSLAPVLDQAAAAEILQKLYRHPEGAFALSYPASWSLQENLGGEGTDVLRAQTGPPVSVSVYRQSWSPATPEILRKVEETLVPAGARVLDWQVDGRPCRVIPQPGDNGLTIWNLLVIDGEKLYYLALAGQFEGPEPGIPNRLRKVVESLEFQKRPK